MLNRKPIIRWKRWCYSRFVGATDIGPEFKF